MGMRLSCFDDFDGHVDLDLNCGGYFDGLLAFKFMAGGSQLNVGLKFAFNGLAKSLRWTSADASANFDRLGL